MTALPRHHSVRTRSLGACLLPALLGIVLSAGGCGVSSGDFRPAAIGREGEITVVIDSTHWKGPVGAALRETVGGDINTLPAPEPAYRLRAVDLTSERQLEELRKQKNLLFVAPLSDTTNTARYLRNVFDAQAQEAIRGGQQALIGRTNLWRQGQQVYYVTGATPEAVVSTLTARGDEIRRAFDVMTRGRLEQDMFDKGRQFALEDTLLARYNFAVNVQHDYLIAMDTTQFVWLRRILSDTWRSLFVHWERANPADLTPAWIHARRDSLTRRYIQGQVMGAVEIDVRRPLTTENIDFLGRYGFETRGLWHVVEHRDGEMIEYGMGGPFLTYTFYDQPTGRIYMIDGMVFAPGFEKREFLRQMEVIAHTFRTSRDVNRTAAARAAD